MGVLKDRRLGEANEVDSEGSWAISYGDMITLLLTFFILFFSTDAQKERMDEMQMDLLIKLDSSSKHASERAPASEEFVGPKLSQVKVYKVGQKMLVEFPNSSFFGLGKIELTKDGERELAEFVKQYLPYAGNFFLGIRAYTDNKKVLQTEGRRFKDNLELSALRSVATMRVLQRLGIPLSRMRLGGYGELNMTSEDLNRAIASEPNYQTDGLKLARKVVLVIEPDLKETL